MPVTTPRPPHTMNLPPAYLHWQDAARRLIEPLAALMHPGEASLAIAGPASDHDAAADRLESFARPLLLAAHWLQSAPRAEDHALREKLAAWFRGGLAAGTDVGGAHYWGPDANYHQHHVEIGLVAIALQIAPAQLWEPLSPEVRDQVARWFGTARGNGIVNNNHYFMGVHILEFLRQHGYGRRADEVIVDEFLTRLEGMHRGGGWFEDGINQAYDHYNAYAFHFYGLWWARLHGARDPARAQRWREWAREFVRDYEHFFAASGEHPAFGRSITYRFNCLNVFGLALLEDCCDLPPGRLRRLSTRNLDFFLSRPIQQEQGCLSLGWTDAFPALAESYSCAASPYWAAKGFAALLLPPQHAFWHAPEELLLSERSDYARVIRPAGLVVRSTAGAVEIVNAGSQISNLNLRFGAWKWSKFAYRTGTGFTLAFPAATHWSLDNALTTQLDDGRIIGRHSTVAIEMDDAHVYFSYNLGVKSGQINTTVESGVWWRAGWLLQLHTYTAQQPVVFRLGGYALPLDAAQAREIAPTGEPSLTQSAFAADGRGTALQPLHGFTAAEWDERRDDRQQRAHISAPYHVTPVARAPRGGGSGWLAALVWTGDQRAEAAPWTVVSLAAGRWALRHPALGDWRISHWSLPALS
ncbi:DUF2264 domain-containing protein [Horticoccus luteus]|uniref:DUF2264 domain-containing protein n=1 Tax=Horticoccus luteus TaxID=2862869 RepID=A0A8F9TTX7_9BACT|nr:DUF2264 domain-containing protein [Horticoccus luteus]QYM78975.1 DUF2264 domain-containing protein [Horticoccus luteus]